MDIGRTMMPSVAPRRRYIRLMLYVFVLSAADWMPAHSVQWASVSAMRLQLHSTVAIIVRQRKCSAFKAIVHSASREWKSKRLFG